MREGTERFMTRGRRLANATEGKQSFNSPRTSELGSVPVFAEQETETQMEQLVQGYAPANHTGILTQVCPTRRLWLPGRQTGSVLLECGLGTVLASLASETPLTPEWGGCRASLTLRRTSPWPLALPPNLS